MRDEEQKDLDNESITLSLRAIKDHCEQGTYQFVDAIRLLAFVIAVAGLGIAICLSAIAFSINP